MNKWIFKIFIFIFFHFRIFNCAIDYKINYIDNQMCELSKCGNVYCSSNAKCDNGTCICNTHFTSKIDDELIKCCYQQKSLLLSFYIETLIGFGLGHFLAGKMFLFYLKGGIYLFLLIINLSFIIYCCRHKKENIKYLRNLFIFIGGMTFIIWQMIDGVLYISHFYKDKNDVDLYY
jgi:hypothetical protein